MQISPQAIRTTRVIVGTRYLYLVRDEFFPRDSRGGAAISTAQVMDPISSLPLTFGKVYFGNSSLGGLFRPVQLDGGLWEGDCPQRSCAVSFLTNNKWRKTLGQDPLLVANAPNNGQSTGFIFHPPRVYTGARTHLHGLPS